MKSNSDVFFDGSDCAMDDTILEFDGFQCSRAVDWLPAGCLAVSSPLNLHMKPGICQFF